MITDAPNAIQKLVVPACKWIFRFTTAEPKHSEKPYGAGTIDLDESSITDIATWFYNFCIDNNYTEGRITCSYDPKLVITFDSKHPKCITMISMKGKRWSVPFELPKKSKPEGFGS